MTSAFLRIARFASAVVLAAAVAGGCASVPDRAGFDEVQRSVTERTGATVHWHLGTPADEAAAESVRAMRSKRPSCGRAVK